LPTVLVTGGGGFVGSHLVEKLVALGTPVRCLVRRTTALKNLPESPLIELAYGDLASGAGVPEALDGIDTVFHLAGVTKANSSALFYRGNVDGTENLVRACERRAAPPERFVHVSSLAALGPGAAGEPVRDDSEPHPLTHYGKSKLAAERIVQNSTLAARAIIVRPPVIFGPRDTDVFQVFRAASKGLALQIGRDESLVSVVYVKDLVRALLAAAACPRAPGRAYFVADPAPVSWVEFSATAAAIMGKRLKSIALPPQAARAVGLMAEIGALVSGKPSIVSREKVAEACCRYWTCDVSRAQTDLGFQPQWTLRDAMAETLAWYRDEAWLKF
jgi:nucleoside-diphosphate-sugar epimerase